MAEMQMMEFPKTVDEFMESYKIVDTEQVYTNGSELVPIFRMRQWFEHLNGADWISVKERLPEPRFSREWYLVSLESGCVMTLAFERAENRWARTGSHVTHWMPLPEPPKEG